MRNTLRALLLAATATAAITHPAAASSVIIINFPGTFSTGGFTARGEITPYGSRASEIHPADLDADGDLDLVLRANQAPAVQIYKNTDGKFEKGLVWEEPEGELLRAVADFDGDGQPDVLLSGTGAGTPVRILYGNGLAGYGPREKSLGSLPGINDGFYVQDIAGSNKPDLILSDRTILDPFQGTPVQTVSTDNSALMNRFERWADWNGDNLPDLFVLKGSTLTYHLNLGGGQFGPAQTRDFPASLAGSPTVEDLRVIRDERLPGTDLAIVAVITDAANNTQKLCLLQESGPEDTEVLFSAPFGGGDDRKGRWFTTSYQEPGDNPLFATAVFDIAPDFTIAENRGEVSEIQLSFKNGKPRLTPKLRVKTERIPDLLQEADLDDDGASDLIVSSTRDGDTAGSDFLYFRGTPKGSHGGKPVAITPPATDDTATHVVDFDGDGDKDLIVLGHSTVNNAQEIALLENNGTARFQRRVILDGLHNAEILSIADRNDDDRPDLVVSSYGWRKNGDGERSVFLSLSGKGKARKTLTLFREAGDSPWDVVRIGDWDGDDVDDLLLWETVLDGQDYEYPVRWLKGAAKHRFGAPQALSYGFYETLQDMDGDGDLDLVPSRKGLRRERPVQNYWRQNNGPQVLPTLVDFPVLGGVTENGYSIVAAEADLNGDGQDDLVSFFETDDGFGSRPVIVNANGTLSWLVAFPYGVPYFQDIDGDGDTDVLMATKPDKFIGRTGLQLIRSSGGTTYAAAVEIAEPSFGIWTPVIAGDLDDDGKQDVIASDIQRRPRIEWFKGD